MKNFIMSAALILAMCGISSARHFAAVPNQVCPLQNVNYNSGGGSGCASVGQPELCYTESGPTSPVNISGLPPAGLDYVSAFDTGSLPPLVANDSALLSTCGAVPGYHACCFANTMILQIPGDPSNTGVISGSHCVYFAAP